MREVFCESMEEGVGPLKPAILGHFQGGYPSGEAKTFLICLLDVDSPIWYYGDVGCSRLSAVAFVSP
jgi:hypothetical protein